MWATLCPVEALTREPGVCGFGRVWDGDAMLFEPGPAAVGDGEGSCRCRGYVAFALESVGDRYSKPSGQMGVTGAGVFESSDRGWGCFEGRCSGEHEQGFDGVGDFFIGELVVAVTSLTIGCDETGFGEACEVFACRLRADVCCEGEFTCGDGTTAHELEQHGGPGGLGE